MGSLGLSSIALDDSISIHLLDQDLFRLLFLLLSAHYLVWVILKEVKLSLSLDFVNVSIFGGTNLFQRFVVLMLGRL